eukprot:729491-Hanusia_phi.AAC.1
MHPRRVTSDLASPIIIQTLKDQVTFPPALFPGRRVRRRARGRGGAARPGPPASPTVSSHSMVGLTRYGRSVHDGGPRRPRPGAGPPGESQ